MADEEHEDDFKYIVRLMNTDLDGELTTLYALTDIKGVGVRVAESILRTAGVSPREKIGKLDDEDIDKLKEHIDKFQKEAPDWMKNRKRDPVTGGYKHLFGADLDMVHREDVNRMKKISCYKGVRHEQGRKVRGQRTRSNGRTGMTLGVQKKLAQERAAAAAEEEEE